MSQPPTEAVGGHLGRYRVEEVLGRPGTPLNTNPSQFCDRAMDRLTAEAKQLQLTDPIRAQDLWARAERRVVDQAPLVGAYNFSRVDLVAERIGNYQCNWVWGQGLADQLWVR